MNKLMPLLLIVLSSNIFAQETAVTESGKKVVLKNDGTWEYVKSDSIPTKIAEFDFRKTNWGMSKEQVKKSETAEFVKEEINYIGYTAKVNNLDAFVFYFFVENKLVRAKYSFIEDHSNENEHISDYISINEILTNKYGAPTSEKVRWLNDLYKDDYSHWGFAVSLGHLKYFSIWENESTKIISVLYGDKYDITHAVEYVSVKLSGLEDMKTKEKQKSEF